MFTVRFIFNRRIFSHLYGARVAVQESLLPGCQGTPSTNLASGQKGERKRELTEEYVSQTLFHIRAR